MIKEGALGAYKNKPVLVLGQGDKIDILFGDGEKLRVREKDIELVHPGPLGDLKELENAVTEASPREAWELLREEGRGISLRELAELVYGDFSPPSAWAARRLLGGSYFSGDPEHIVCRPPEEAEAAERKRREKDRETDEREGLFKALKSGAFRLTEENEAPVRRQLQDAEALALGRTAKSRSLRELGRPETPKEAHRLLLSIGMWQKKDNPHPERFGLSRSPAAALPSPPPPEDRVDLRGLPAFAIDNPWSNDPDDAVSLERGPGSRRTLYVHVADPASSVLPGSPPDLEARNRGTTLYLPEGSFPMLAPESLGLFALGLKEESPALTFRITLNEDLSIAETSVFPSLVSVSRLSYGEADREEPPPEAGGPEGLGGLFAFAGENAERRLNTGAVFIDFPEVHITVRGEDAAIEEIPPHRSAEMVRECMILAGEAAAKWALQKRLPFPFIGQEAGELPEKRLEGLAGAYQIRRCMRPRSLSTRPAVHWGLGLDEYTQVTSPLRRYTDLLAHQQIRALLRGEAPLTVEVVLLRVSAAEAAASAAAKAERASRLHWTCVYLSDKKDSLWEGIVMDKKGALVLIPALGLETQVPLRKGELNGKVTLALKSVDIPGGELVFSEI
ncbi:MAG: RNB domain-containing ribonuclease [Treponema sp.]|jgi:exoribonuclease-2|nr:RNB domain-containing ribonuclease [Treponema sp.]